MWIFLLTIGPLVQEKLIALGFQPTPFCKLRLENKYSQPKKSLIFVANIMIFSRWEGVWWIRYHLWGQLMQHNSCIRYCQFGNWAYIHQVHKTFLWHPAFSISLVWNQSWHWHPGLAWTPASASMAYRFHPTNGSRFLVRSSLMKQEGSFLAREQFIPFVNGKIIPLEQHAPRPLPDIKRYWKFALG